MQLHIVKNTTFCPQTTFCTPQRTICRPSRRQFLRATAALDSSAALAVAQQVAAFAAVVGGEAALTGLNTSAETPGRPQVVPTAIGAGATAVAAVLVGQGDAVGTAGCVVGFLAAGFMMLQYVQRVKDTPYNPEDWPGAKSWPAVMCLITFFELAATFQGLEDGIGLLRQVTQ